MIGSFSPMTNYLSLSRAPLDIGSFSPMTNCLSLSRAPLDLMLLIFQYKDLNMIRDFEKLDLLKPFDK